MENEEGKDSANHCPFSGKISEDIKGDIKEIRVESSVGLLEEVCFLVTARIIKKVLNRWKEQISWCLRPRP